VLNILCFCQNISVHIKWLLDVLSTWVKWPPSHAEFKNEWKITSSPPYIFVLGTGTGLLPAFAGSVCNITTFNNGGYRNCMCMYREHDGVCRVLATELVTYIL